MKRQTPTTANVHGRRRANRDPRKYGRRPADRARCELLEEALDAAAQLAEPYPEEAESIDNVIRFVRARRHGQAAEIRISDVLLTLSISFCALDCAFTPAERDVVEALLRIPTRGGVVRLPAAAPVPPPALALDPRAVPAPCRGLELTPSTITPVPLAA